MLQLDTGIGNFSPATQAVVAGFLHHLKTMLLWYPHRTHRPRPSGSLILTRTQKKDMTCQETIPILSSSSFPAYSSTTNTQCLCTSQHRTHAVTPRTLGPGAPGRKTSSAPGCHTTFLLQVGLQAFTPVSLISFSVPIWVPLAFSWSSIMLSYLIATPSAFKKLIKPGTLLLLATVCVWGRGWPSSTSCSWAVGQLGTWLEIGSSYWVLEAGTAGSFCLASQMLDLPLPIAGFYWSASCSL